MADPLSIAASVAGLLTTAGKIYSVLSGFVNSVVDAPESARATLSTVEELRFALEMVQHLVDTISSLPARRRQFVRLDHVAITFTNCVLTLSELESLICYENGILHRLKWAWGEKKILSLIPRLESQKSSLSLMISVLHCQSEMEALQARDRLNAAVELILQRDPGLAANLARLDDSFEGQVPSIRVFDNESMAESSTTGAVGIPASAATPSSSDASGSLIESITSLTRREFEEVLDQSRVYTRVEYNGSDASFTSSTLRSHAWSHLSLNDVSIVSVFRLPITLDDIDSFGAGLTFSMLLQPAGKQVLASRQQPRAPVPAERSAGDDKTRTHDPFLDPGVKNLRALVHHDYQKTGSHQIDLVKGETIQDIRMFLDEIWLGTNMFGQRGQFPSNYVELLFDPTPPRSPARNPRTPNHKPAKRKATQKPTYVNGTAIAGTIKLIVVGDHSTEKTRTLMTYTQGSYPTEYVPTVFDNYGVTIMIGDESYTLGLFDTSGQEDYARLRPLSYPDTDVFLVFARIGLPSTYENAEKLWIPEIQLHCPGIPFIIVGTKGIGGGCTSETVGKALASRTGAVKYLECNLLTKVGLKDVFDEAIVAALEPPQQKARASRRSWRPGFLRTVAETRDGTKDGTTDEEELRG